ncbi:MAG: Flp pilus assembly complex ATPase component TadA [Bdellovibrionales bacterium]|nr:Flp pilus assembly complex ATPase component TadA [Bdellovibrionales bacterium]
MATMNDGSGSGAFRVASPGLKGLLQRLALVSAVDIEAAERAAKDRKLLAALAERELIDEDIVLKRISDDLGIELVDLDDPTVQQSMRECSFSLKLDSAVALEHRCVPIRKVQQQVVVALADPLDLETIRLLEFVLEAPVRPALAAERAIRAALSRVSGSRDVAAAVEQVYPEEHVDREVRSLELSVGEVDESDSASVKAGSESAPVVRLVSRILADALLQEASDIHIEPTNDSLEIRFRIDGIMHSQLSIPKRLQPYAATRLKLLAGMDITERRRPQDGRFRIKGPDGQFADIRASSVPTPYGETLVLRILRAGINKLRLDLLGMDEQTLSRFKEVLTLRDRMIAVTGPTGSGKSTTLYASIIHVREGTTNIITVEDPIEYRLEGVTQIQVDEKVGMTFASGLRSILRQDPDIILIGEVRDLETAEISFQAAQTGHLVLTTLHTNTAASAIVRLLDLGLEPFLIAPSLGAILAQRLVRVLCGQCSRPLTEEEAQALERSTGVQSDALRAAVGCRACGQTGYRGRRGIYSLLVVDSDVREVIRSGGSEQAIEEAARANGMRSMYDAALDLVRQGATTFEEVERVLGKQRARTSGAAPEMPPQVPKEVKALQFAEEAPTAEPLGIESAPVAVVDLTSAEELTDFFVAGVEQALGDYDFTSAIDAAEHAAEKATSIADLAASYHGKAAGGGTHRILLVDDDAGVRAVMSRTLRKAHFDVAEAGDGVEALEKVGTFKPDLIVCDLSMPRLSGEGFVKALREKEGEQHAKVLMLTGSDDEANEIRLLEAGANDFVSKNASPAVVVARIRRLLP